MEYSIKALADLAGVTPRTLRWYDRLGLLRPGRITEAGYRLYGPQEVERLQQILFYRELGLSLQAIKAVLDDPAFDRQQALQSHLTALRERQKRLEGLILTVERTIQESKGEITMTDKEKFEAFKKKAVEENEAKYGKEVRAKYGDEEMERTNETMLGLTQEEYQAWQALDREIREGLERAVRMEEEPTGAEGQRIAKLHRDWLTCAMGGYDAARHAGIAELYVQDARFTAYYDGEVTGCARFLRDAIRYYAAQQ